MDVPPATEPLNGEGGRGSQAWLAHFEAAAMRSKNHGDRIKALEVSGPAEVARAEAAEAALDARVDVLEAGVLYPGMLVAAAFDVPIPGYARANGGTVSRAANPVLFGVYGTTYGAGDGTTTFGLPNLANDGTSSLRRWYVKLG